MLTDTTLFFFKSGLTRFSHKLKREMWIIEKFSSHIENLWVNKYKGANEFMHQLLTDYPDEKDDIVDSHIFYLREFQVELPLIHRKSLIVTIYSVLEAEFDRLCEIVADSLSSNVHVDDLKGNGIMRARRYLELIGGFDFQPIEGQWNYVQNLKHLRNTIVHREGMLQSNDKALITFISKNTYLEGNSGYEIQIRDGFIKEVVEKIVELADSLQPEIVAFMRRNNSDLSSEIQGKQP